MKFVLLAFVLFHFLASCVKPTPTTPPDALAPTTIRGGGSTETSLGDLPWRQLYDDPVLQSLIEQALQRNYTVQLAVTAVLAAEANLGITAANQAVIVNGAVQAPYFATAGSRPPYMAGNQFVPQAGIVATYQVDLFGKLASATAASRAQLLATDAARLTVFATVVSQVASGYFELRELDTALQVSEEAATARREGVRLMTLRVRGGESSLQDLRQAEQALYEVTQNIPAIRRNIARTENALSLLVGDYPQTIARGRPLEDQVRLPEVPPTGVASGLLQRRPDIQQAEYVVASAAGNVDVARKLLYPSFSIGASAAVGGSLANGLYTGFPQQLAALTAVNGVFYGPLGLFSILPQLVQPIFNGGQIRSQIRLAQAQQQQAALSYLQTVHQAFEEAASAVASYTESRQRTVQLQLYAEASRDSVRLANLRYQNGFTSYLEVLDAQTRDYQAEINLQQSLLNERLALVQLYLSLGGGWR